MKLRLDLRLSQKLIMTPQLQQAIKLLQLSRLELQQSLAQHLMENPLLDELSEEVEENESTTAEEKAEEAAASASPANETSETDESSTPEERDTPDEVSAAGWEEYFGSDRRTGGSEGQSSSSDDFPSYEQTVAKAASLEDHLLWQLSLSGLSERNKAIGRLLIGNLDDDGYLRTPLSEIVTGTDFTEAEAESVLRDIQTFDPTGVGARDLPECLMLQLGHLGKSPMGSLGARPGALKGSIVEAVVLHHLKDLEKKQYAKVAKALDVTVEEIFQATKVIEALEPKPGRPFSNTQNYVIVPDVDRKSTRLNSSHSQISYAVFCLKKKKKKKNK